MGPEVASQVPVERAAWPGNAEGIRKHTLPTAAKFIMEGGDDPKVQGVAANIVRLAGFPKTILGKATAVQEHLKKHMGFGDDPPMRERLQKAQISLCVEGAVACIPYGDCDDHLIAAGALLRALGIQVWIMLIEYGGGAQDHVIIAFRSDDGRKLEFDSTPPYKPIGHVSAGKKTLVDPLDPKVTGALADGMFMGVGKAPGADEGPIDTSLPYARLGAGLATSVDVMTYRVLWNQYVTDTVNAAQNCATAYAATAATQTDPTLKSDLQGRSVQILAAANSILASWNAWQNQTPGVILVRASEILQDFQATVLAAGKLRDNITTGTLTCILEYAGPDGPVAAVSAPDPSLQAQVIGRLEGLQLLGAGILEVYAEGTAESLKRLGTAADVAAKLAGNTAGWLLSPWTWLTVGVLLVGTTAVVVYNADKVSKLVASASPLGRVGERVSETPRWLRAKATSKSKSRRAA